MKRACIFVGLALLALSAFVVAQQPDPPATKEDVQKLFEVLHSRQTFNTMMALGKQQVKAMLPQIMEKTLPNATPEQKEEMSRFLDETSEKMFKDMPVDELIAASVPAYQHHLTHHDVEQMVQFYSSPVGQKFLNEMPALLAETMQAQAPVMRTWMEQHLGELQKDAEQFAASLVKQKQQP